MATTTTNFGWDIPQSTDLVKDGATAIAALGQDIDTALVDLKGGTTGQVLSKASGTDLDYSWVTTDDANAIQNAIVDAKGDLIAATAADTPARLAVGANDTMLVADSTAATGLSYKSATTLYPWTAFTPTPANLTVGNGTLTARYQQIGKTVIAEFYFALGSTSAVTGLPAFTLPVTAKVSNFTPVGVAGFGDFGVGTFIAVPIIYSGSIVYIAMVGSSATYAREDGNVNATTPFTWVTNDTIIARMTYEAA
jgi:hypothetical protein